MRETEYTVANSTVMNAMESMKRLVDRPDREKVEFLTEIHKRGETPEEIAGFAMALRDMAEINVKYPGLTDVVGTGGDGKNTVNVSTAVSIVLASMGIKTAKHGNFGITGHHGSADFMKYTGYNFYMDENEIIRNLDSKNYVYILAPQYNKSFAKFASARKMISFRTVFNILGPLTNPLNPERVVLGTYSDDLADLYAHVILQEGKKGFIIHSSDGMDEISPNSENLLYYVNGKIEKTKIDPVNLTGHSTGIERISTVDPEKSFKMLLSGLSGENRDVEEFIGLNAVPAIMINGMANTAEEAFDLAVKSIESGIAIKKLKEVCK
ncbi:MAG: anthranilate phosphoribosyltransferase [Ferroplasma sp.]|uniref:anthranilate phosphoribosyltransferase n=1 Tax=Ferroplasma sp. TaxID=2591003 RepID=UPI002816024B|nr:anthranilate phosphoribosyltransferase [Ferroplasma sp.]WMT51424.1 MAG: anthranilate phosphoribosyltransferase [Ferroplasma sp.]